MTNRELWFRLVVRAFPKDYRVDHEDEIIDAVLAVSPSGVWAGARESLALIRAGFGVSTRRDQTGTRFRTAVGWGAAVWLGLSLGAGGFLRPIGAAITSASMSEYLTMDWAALTGALFLLGAVLLAGRNKWAAGLAAAAGVILTALWNSDPYWVFSESLWLELKWLAPALTAYIVLAGRPARPPGWALALVPAAVTMMVLLALGSGTLGRSYSSLVLIEGVPQMILFLGLLALGLIWAVPGMGAMAIVPIAHFTVVRTLQRPSTEVFMGIIALMYFALAAHYTLRRRHRNATPELG